VKRIIFSARLAASVKGTNRRYRHGQGTHDEVLSDEVNAGYATICARLLKPCPCF
jgi:hypothetical protein